ncbi:aspartate aminotransferase family protein [Acuticoccus mangrovi]|uniref:Aspartate aminotransferase family protein n=1 Tax=Acuticoccus mangrovi TaxID=2796142 RepID=A0A934MK13_9HYPH|nr:aspartate aminotransferase family protein [Acuticoccus mangrovi]MBJ3778871.1 aspartate aminotransferase family protein [Acuticoccus mangrovi]
MTYLLDPYNRAPIEIVRGEGVHVWDSTGRRYLDFIGGMAVVAFGHCHPVLVAALERQARTLWTASNILRTGEAEQLAERLARASFADKVFFGTSGAEVVDLALKLVRRYFKSTATPERWRVITMDNAYHGRTMAAIAAGGSAKLREGYEPLVDGFDMVDFGDLDAVRAAIGPETGAILIEPIQGDGGIRVASPAYLRGLRAVADEHCLLLLYDEVQSGMGRTGKLFAYQNSGVAPDILVTSKGLGCGFPLSALLTTEAVARTVGPGSHGGTLNGAPLGMAVGSAALDLMLADGFLDQVTETGRYFKERLEEVAARRPETFREVRGVGLMIGLVCGPANGAVATALRERGLLVAQASGNVLRLLPPLVVTGADIDRAMEIFEDVATAPLAA